MAIAGILSKLTATGIGKIFDSLGETVDRFVMTKEEKERVKLEIANARNQADALLLEFSGKLVEVQSSIVIAEAQGNWLQRSWRPLMAMVYVCVIGWQYMIQPLLLQFGIGVEPIPLPSEFWTTNSILIGGYVTSRAIEKYIMTRRNSNDPINNE